MASKILAVMVLALLGASPLVEAGSPQGTPQTGPTYMNAVVVSTDVTGSKITVRPKGKEPQTLSVDSALAAQLGQLKPGDAVVVTMRLGRVTHVRRAGRPRPGPLTPPGAPPVPTPPAPPTLHPGPPASPGPVISATPAPTPNPWRTPRPVPTPKPVPTPRRVFPSPEFTVPPSPGPSPTPTPGPS